MRQLWRANTLGILEIRARPGEPIPGTTMKELIAAAVREGLWQPELEDGSGSGEATEAPARAVAARAR